MFQLFVRLSVVALHLLLVQCNIVRSATSGDSQKYSYFCLEYNQTLCLGISPGDTDPVYDPTSIYYLQVKSRTNAEYTNTDYKKTRWDANYTANRINLSRFPDLCAAKQAYSDRVGLFPCNQTQIWPDYYPSVPYGIWDLSLFSQNLNGAGTLELVGSRGSQCLTVMSCQSDGNDWCNPDSTDVAWDTVRNVPSGLRRGSYVRFRPCSDSPGGDPTWSGVQIWRQRLDCAAGCSPYLQYNQQCDQACNREECDWDNQQCRTKSPTPPTRKPTPAITTSPTSRPISRSPTLSPTTQSPSGSPSKSPTVSPSISPTLQPSFVPSTTPTVSPTIPCPAQGVMDLCASMNQNRCTKDKVAKEQCIWCLDKCSPRVDPRVCIIPTFWDHCQMICPTDQQRLNCPKYLTAKMCTNNKWKRTNCVWCPVTNRCAPGRDMRQCSNPTLFDHCGTVAPTGPPCPALSTLNMCLRAKSQAQCPPKSCTWCAGTVDTAFPCRPSRSLDVCKVNGWSTAKELIALFFRNCPALYPTPRPSRAPTVITAKPTLSPRGSRPTGSPVTSRPSRAPIFAPTRSPVTSRPSLAPTNKPTLLPSRSPQFPTKLPTSGSPTFLPSKSPVVPTQRPTVSKPTRSPTTSRPSRAPSQPVTRKPTPVFVSPSRVPTTSHPTRSPVEPRRPVTREPTTAFISPSRVPTISRPSRSPTRTPTTRDPTVTPSRSPTVSSPTRSPTPMPTTKHPTNKPIVSAKPSASPTATPSRMPTVHPSHSPTISAPSGSPSKQPSRAPITSVPSSAPSSSAPSHSPTKLPTMMPSKSPSISPSVSFPTISPTDKPTKRPSDSPSVAPSSSSPTKSPSVSMPTSSPSNAPSSSAPSSGPTSRPSADPSEAPSASPSIASASVSPSTPPSSIQEE